MSPPAWKTLDDLDPQALYVLPLGVGNAFTDRYYHSSLLLIAGCQPVLIDAPAPLRRVVREGCAKSGLVLDAAQIDHLLLTHLHGDHCNGVEELAFVKKYLDHGRRPHLYCLDEIAGPLWDHRLRAAMGGSDSATGEAKSISDYIQVHPINPAESFRLAGGRLHLTVEFRRTRHSIPCAAMRITYGRARFGYSADTPFDPELIDFLAPCDMIVHEAGGHPAVHTPLEDLERLDAGLRSRLWITHYPDDLHPSSTPLQMLEQGHLYTVEPGPVPHRSGTPA